MLALGNPILSDDGVGWRVVQEVERLLAGSAPLGWEIDYFSLGGISLMERLVGYDRAILVDAIQTRDGKPGAIYRLTLDDVPTYNADAVHDASLKDALALGRQLGAKLPKEIIIYAIEAVELREFNQALTPAVEAAILPAARQIVKEVSNPPF